MILYYLVGYCQVVPPSISIEIDRKCTFMSRDQLPQVFRTYIPGKPVETDRLLKMKRAVPDELLAIINKMIGDVTHGEMTEILHGTC